MGRRAQIKMFETIAILVVFFFLLIGGSAFYFGAQRSALQKEKVKASEQIAFNTVLNMLYMPELDCSFLATQRDNCIDKVKLMEFKGLFERSERALTDYFGVFGYSTVAVSEEYPSASETVVYENVPDEYASSITSLNPVLLFDPLKEEYAFGIIEVTVYVQ